MGVPAALRAEAARLLADAGELGAAKGSRRIARGGTGGEGFPAARPRGTGGRGFTRP
ncbi:hypothetical protein ACIQ6Y_07795 [Streptomyces sp. NPDC096205]|uniref:hypothetical protein n=1 Tax=Streptomyces sp. NPDC096205 TaxID=3366081 RepID=UPI00380EE7CA